MGKAKPTGDPRSGVTKGTCAHPGCTRKISENDFCYGCRLWICAAHSTNFELIGHGHAVADHWKEEDDDGW